MKKLLTIIFCLAVILDLPAQTNPAPVRLAIISESPETVAAADLLTAEFSKNDRIQMLERAEIEKVYREQGLSAGNTDYLKLGKLLGADGLLLMATNLEGTNQFLMVRLVAVKPGVVLADEKFPWPIANLTEWSPAFAGHLGLLLPKLSVTAKDAVPISVVNLRSAVSSADGVETERELKLLVLQRLTQEPQLFVLERQKMQLLSEEKDLNADESAFWNGAYLLEGVIDQNGHSQETVTINARLTPPKGGTPVLIKAVGSRANFAEAVNQLTAKVDAALKISATSPEWNAADEAAQYFDEAKWALRWRVWREAETAAETAWALGKKDLDCALVRIRAYVSEVNQNIGSIQSGESGISPGYNADGKPTGPEPSEAELQMAIKEIVDENPFGVAYHVRKFGSGIGIDYAFITEPPDPREIDRALLALELYQQFCQASPDGEPKVLWHGTGWNDWHDSDWYQLGIDDLTAASRVLQKFNFVPESQAPVADKLGELRALARTVAETISQSPTVHDSYFVGDRVVTHDELGTTIDESPSIFRCKVNWGCYWQETPEAAIALYRDLMSSPVFCYLHEDFWFRPVARPRLVAWNENDRQRLATVWNDFLQEADVSTNVFMMMEGKATRFRDAATAAETATSITNFFEAFLENRCAFLANNVEVLYLNWRVDDLVDAIGGYRDEPGGAIEGAVSDESDGLKKLCAQYLAKLREKDASAECSQALAERGNPQEFDKQKAFLKAGKPFDPTEFFTVFTTGYTTYSKTEARELLPLLANYKAGLSGTWAFAGKMQVQDLENSVNRILNPPPPQPAAQAPLPKPAPIPPVAVASAPVRIPETNIDILTVDKFLEIPLDSFIQASGMGTIDNSTVTVASQHWMEGKLLLEFECHLLSRQYGAYDGQAIGLFDPVTEHWDIISCPTEEIQVQNNFYHRIALLHGELFYSNGGQIRKYDFHSGEWQALPVSDGGNYELFAVNDQLYAANWNTIFEITDGGKSTRILASTRRQPPASALDREDLGTPTLFEGPGHSLRVCTSSKIFTWTGADWREDSAAPPSSFPPVISADEIMFRGDGFNLPAAIFRLMVDTNTVECLLGQKRVHDNNTAFLPDGHSHPEQPLWQVPGELPLTALPAAGDGAELFLLEDHSVLQEVAGARPELTQKKIIAKDGYHAVLMCLSPGLPSPQKIYLKFDHPAGCPPVAGLGSGLGSIPWNPSPVWMCCTTNYLIFGLQKSSLFSHFLPDENDRAGTGHQAGIWLLPLEEIENRIAGQKQAWAGQQQQAAAQAEQARKNLIAKFDLNHNGIIDPDEKEAALDDPAFIESELDAIDANHNGWLDADELAYFDANHNKILDPKEQAGIDIAQHLLAVRLMKKFDANSDGKLDRSEFNDLESSLGLAARTSARPLNMPMNFRSYGGDFPDDNHDSYVDLTELENFLKQQTRHSLRQHGASTLAMMRTANIGENSALSPQQMFKMAVEFYWQNPGGATNRPSFNHPPFTGTPP